MQEPEIHPVDPTSLSSLVGEERMQRVLKLAADVADRVLDGCVYCVNSTASGGGVAEMLAVDMSYIRGAGVDCRWLVIEGEQEFYELTKRLHNRLHGSKSGDGELGQAEHEAYERVLAPNISELLDRVTPRDIVILHDPQTAGMIPALVQANIPTIWRCHIGRDETNEYTEQAWGFLRPYLPEAYAFVFSRKQYVPDYLDADKVTIIPPAIDPSSPKNRDMELDVARSILGAAGLIEADPEGPPPEFEEWDGPKHRVQRQAEVVRAGGPISPDVPMVVQVSRWDRLKDMAGVLRGFAEHIPGRDDVNGAHLVLAGPSVAGVADDPEGQEVLGECTEIWESLDAEAQRCVTLASLPMDDPTENAAIVNALQRHAAVVVQKSLVEGFGLTVAEAMWKSRPVVASAVGGILDQITDGENGVLLEDPEDLATFAREVGNLVADLDRAHALGEAARKRVLGHFLPDRQLAQWAEVLVQLEQTRGTPRDLETLAEAKAPANKVE